MQFIKEHVIYKVVEIIYGKKLHTDILWIDYYQNEIFVLIQLLV